MLLDLGQPTQVTKAVLELGSKNLGRHRLRLPGRHPRQRHARSGPDGQTGTVTLNGPKALPKTDYVIVWFTSLAPGQDGRFRASLAEVTVR